MREGEAAAAAQALQEATAAIGLRARLMPADAEHAASSSTQARAALLNRDRAALVRCCGAVVAEQLLAAAPEDLFVNPPRVARGPSGAESAIDAAAAPPAAPPPVASGLSMPLAASALGETHECGSIAAAVAGSAPPQGASMLQLTSDFVPITAAQLS